MTTVKIKKKINVIEEGYFTSDDTTYYPNICFHSIKHVSYDPDSDCITITGTNIIEVEETPEDRWREFIK